jgi:O-antigen/teichoic acid export membrane protein
MGPSLWSAAEYVTYPALMLVATPLLLRSLGAQQFGLWSFQTAIIGVGTAINVGTSAAVLRAMSLTSRRDRVLIGRVLSESLALAIVAGAALSALVACVFVFGATNLFARMGTQSQVITAGIVGAMALWLEQIDGVFSAALKGDQAFRRAASLELSSKALQLTAVTAVGWTTGRLGPMYVAFLLTAAVRVSLKAQAVRRYFDVEIRPRYTKSIELLATAKWGWLQGLGGLLFGVADRFIVGAVLGAVALAHYSVALQLAQQVHALSASWFSVLFPRVARETKDRPGSPLRLVLARSMGASFLFSTTLAGALYLFAHPILVLWLGTHASADVEHVLPLLIAAYWLMALNVVPHFLLLATGHMRFLALTNLAAGIVLCAMLVILSKSNGILGASTARIAYGALLFMNLYPLLSERSKTTPPKASPK